MTTESRTALITGASSGIGAAIALEMATRGWKLAIGARRADRLAETAEKARAQGAAEVYAGDLDVTDDASVERFFEASEKRPRCRGRDREQRRSVALPLARGDRCPLAPQRDRDESDRPDGRDPAGARAAACRGNGSGRRDGEQRRRASPAPRPAGLRRLEGGPRELLGGAEPGARGHRHTRHQAAARPGAQRVRPGLGSGARDDAEADGALGLLRPARRAHAGPGQPGHPDAGRRRA